MASGVLDMALDDVIHQQKGERKGNRGGIGGNRRNNELGQYNNQGTGGVFRRERFNSRNNVPYNSRRQDNSMDVDNVLEEESSVWGHDMFEKGEVEGSNNTTQRGRRQRRPSGRVTSIETGVKVLVSNLDYGVSEDDLKELFGQCGEVKRVSVRYDKSGRSEGSSIVVFANRNDANDAIKKYNGVELDGKSMSVTLAPAPVVNTYRNNTGGRSNQRTADSGTTLFVSTAEGGRRIVEGGNNRGRSGPRPGRRAVFRSNRPNRDN